MPTRLEETVAALKVFLDPPPYKVGHDNDTGPRDDYYHEWWTVAGLKFECEAAAKAFLAVLTA